MALATRGSDARDNCCGRARTMLNWFVIKRISIERGLILILFVGFTVAADEVPSPPATDALVIQSVTVNSKTLQPNSEKELSLGASPENIAFRIESSLAGRRPMRLRYKLEGFDTSWRETPGVMNMAIRFSDDSGDVVEFNTRQFEVTGESKGWIGTLEGSALTHRREKVMVPPRATQWQVIISSAGPPSTVGIYVVDDLVVSKLGASNQSS